MLFSVLTRKGSLKAQLSPCNVPVLVNGKQISASSSFSARFPHSAQPSSLTPGRRTHEGTLARMEVEQYHPAGLGAGGFHPLPSDRHLAQCLTPRKRSRNASLPSSSSLCLVGLSLLLWTWALRCGFQGARRCFCLSRHPPLQAGQLAGCCPDLPADPGLSPCRALMGSKDRLDFQEPEGCR